MKNRLGLILLIGVGVLAISTAAPLIKLCNDTPAVVIAAARMGLASAIFLAGTAVVGRRNPLRVRAADAKYVLLAGTCLAAHFFFWMTSLKHTSVLSSVVIVTVNPLFVSLASFVLFKERLSPTLMFAIALACVGGALIALSDAGKAAAESSLYGDLLALAGAVMASCYLLAGRRVRGRVDLVSYVTPVYTVAAVLLILLVLATGHGFLGYSGRTYWCFLLLAVVPQVLGHTVFNWALRHLTATTITVFILGEPIGAGLIAYWKLGEGVTPLQVVGSVLILGGIATVAGAEAREAQKLPVRPRVPPQVDTLRD